MNTWRKESHKVIAKVIADNPGATGPALKKLLSEAYPFGERKYWPYKVWCDAVRQACGVTRKPKPIDALPLFQEDTP